MVSPLGARPPTSPKTVPSPRGARTDRNTGGPMLGGQEAVGNSPPQHMNMNYDAYFGRRPDTVSYVRVESPPRTKSRQKARPASARPRSLEPLDVDPSHSHPGRSMMMSGEDGSAGDPGSRAVTPWSPKAMFQVPRALSPPRDGDENMADMTLNLPAINLLSTSSSKDLNPKQAAHRGRFGRPLGPKKTPGGHACLQPGWETGDDFPRLQHCLLPWLFFKHEMSSVPALGGKLVPSRFAKGMFLDFWLKDWPKKGITTPMHGVYEGCYRDLLDDLDGIVRMLRQINTRAPELKEVPEFKEPEMEELPVFTAPIPVSEPPMPEDHVEVMLKPFDPPEDTPYPESDWASQSQGLPARPQPLQIPMYIPPTPQTIEPFEPPVMQGEYVGPLPDPLPIVDDPGEPPVLREEPQYKEPPEPTYRRFGAGQVAMSKLTVQNPAPFTMEPMSLPEFQLDVEVEISYVPIYEGAKELRIAVNFVTPFSVPRAYVPPGPPEYPQLLNLRPKELPEFDEEFWPDCDDLKEPEYNPPQEEPQPEFVPAILVDLPVFVEPSPPEPVGYLPGVRPLLIVDLSGTMHGCEVAMRRVVQELLHPDGELTCSALFFEVIIFNRSARCFGVEQRFLDEKRREVEMHKPNAAGRQPYTRPSTGRPQIRPQSAVKAEVSRRNGRPMLRCTPHAADLASQWIRQVPTVGPTNMRSGLKEVVEYKMADCVYLVTDGRADHPLGVLEYIADEVELGNWTVPVHCIGVECNTAGRRLLEAVAEMTEGSFTPYMWDGHATSQPRPDEEAWSAEELRIIRRANMEMGLTSESLHVTMGKVRQSFHEKFIAHRLAENQEAEEQAESTYAAAMAAWEERARQAEERCKEEWRLAKELVEAERTRRWDEAKAVWADICRDIQEHNDDLLRRSNEIEMAQQNHAQAVEDWKLECIRLREEDEKKQMPQVEKNNTKKMNYLLAKHERATTFVTNHNAKYEADKVAHAEQLQEYERQVRDLYAEALFKFQVKQAKQRVDFEEACDKALAVHNEKVEGVRSLNAKAMEAYDDAVHEYKEYLKAYEEWQIEVKIITQQRDEADARARDTYAETLVKAKERWESKKAAIERANEREMDISKLKHEAEVKAVKKRNAANYTAWQQTTAALQHAIAVARARHRWACLAVYWQNIRARKVARVFWHSENLNKEITARRLHNQSIQLWNMQVQEIRHENERLANHAATTFQTKLTKVKARNDNLMTTAREEHRRRVSDIHDWNERVIPKIQRAAAIKQELDYCEAFLKQIRLFAGERLDRVVEMSSIHKALQQAVPGGIPWPELNTVHLLGRDASPPPSAPLPAGALGLHGGGLSGTTRPNTALDMMQMGPSRADTPGMTSMFGEIPPVGISTARFDDIFGDSRPASARSHTKDEDERPHNYGVGGEPLCWFDKLRTISHELKRNNPDINSMRNMIERRRDLLSRPAGLPARMSQPNFKHRVITQYSGSSFFLKPQTPI